MSPVTCMGTSLLTLCVPVMVKQLQGGDWVMFPSCCFLIGGSDASGTLKGSWQCVITSPEVSIRVDQHEPEGRELQ